MALSPSRRRLLQWPAAASVVALGGCGMSNSEQKAPAPGSAKATGYVMPLESAPHERTFMQWPMMADAYGGADNLNNVRENIALLARTIAKFEPVVMLGPEAEGKTIKEATRNKVEHWAINTNDLWCRDAGPTFVQNAEGALAIVDLNFNGWGEEQRFDHDAEIVKKIASRMDMPLFNAGVVGEGGGLDTDGAGTLIAHESSWVDDYRNFEKRDVIEKRLLDALGAEKMIWGPGLAEQDITDYHIDSLARFVKPGTVLIQLPKQVDPYDPFSKAAYQTYEILKKATDANGNPFELVVVPEPENTRSQAEDLMASYTNYYVCNGAVISAEYGDDDADLQARATLQHLYPGREIVMLNIDAICESGGGVHCATQQQPASRT